MKTEILSIDLIKSNESNPRFIKDENFEKLVNSIKSFPEMMLIRPLVIDETNTVLGGNMRLKACIELGKTEVPVVRIEDLTEEKKKEFIIKDNVGFGSWDWDILANEWDNEELQDWGLDVWQPENDIDYSILDEEDLSSELGDMAGGVKKAIQIEFEAEHYEEAYELVKFWREQGDVGYMILQYLRDEKEKINI